LEDNAGVIPKTGLAVATRDATTAGVVAEEELTTGTAVAAEVIPTEKTTGSRKGKRKLLA